MSSIDAQLFTCDFDAVGTGLKSFRIHFTSLPRLISRLPPALAALLAHLPGMALAAALAVSSIDLPLSMLLPVVSVSAALLAWLWRLPIWWRYINLFFLPLVGLALYLQTNGLSINPNWYLAAFVLLALTSFGAVRSRVPLYLSSPRAADELAQRIPLQGRLIDLGCGLGGPLARIGNQRPDAYLAGIETAPLNWLIAKLRLLGRADIRLGSLWDADLSSYDVVYAYLSPAPMARLWKKARNEMKPGSLFISNTFSIPESSPAERNEADEIVELDDLSNARLLIWRM